MRLLLVDGKGVGGRQILKTYKTQHGLIIVHWSMRDASRGVYLPGVESCRCEGEICMGGGGAVKMLRS